MKDYTLPKYDKCRDWIRSARDNGKDWEKIIFALKPNEKALEKFLETRVEEDFWPEIDMLDWKELVQRVREEENSIIEIERNSKSAILGDENQENAVKSPPQNEKSAWVLYKSHLLKNNFKASAVLEIEKATVRLLKRLSLDTRNTNPIKGLVIGNVQSGKTANMAALMAQAADYGWNMFILLSGTIENLRQQTQNRLLNDLDHSGNLSWSKLEYLSKTGNNKAQHLHLGKGKKERYFTVCLKNKNRLISLIQWLQSDQNKQRQMRILVIDDEADQAGINTADVDTEERKQINKLIVNLVNGNDENGKKTKSKFHAMNYIGYTATPYANVLNESGVESLYPKDFIMTLSISDEYFGPQQIFGADSERYEGMNIIRPIESRDIELVKNIHDGVLNKMPKSLMESICWFLCGAACMRFWEYKKPISMLIHTSQKTDHHENIGNLLFRWFQGKSYSELELIIVRCKEIWLREITEFKLSHFKEQFKDYGKIDEVNDYPEFDNIEKHIRRLIGNVTSIMMGNDNKLHYNDGIHLCIDNCKKNGVSEDGMYLRLAYPDNSNMPDPAPVFIVIGGATLSRGLTIEGLISTYFLRTVGQADTLMQMGRWFGYRKGYELIPRIWMSERTFSQFRYLSEMDLQLRELIWEMDHAGTKPSKCGPKIKNSPMNSLIRLTAKNKMQSAINTDMDFSGSYNQTYLFDINVENLKNNKIVVEEFINDLGKPEDIKACNLKHSKHALIWRSVKFSVIEKMLRQYKFQERLRVFNDISCLSEWINKITLEGKLCDWNVIVAGNQRNEKDKSKKKWNLKYGEVTKITRTRKTDTEIAKREGYIDIGVLRNPTDIVADVDLEKAPDSLKQRFKKISSKEVKLLRNDAGLENTPQLIIYCIDKESKATTETREDLKVKEDIVGLCINIPGGKRGSDYATCVTIKLKDTEFNDMNKEGEINEG